MKEEPRNIHKTRASMTKETISLVTKMFTTRREMIACPKLDCRAERTLSLNGKNHVGPIVKCSNCSRKTSEWQLANLLGITPDPPNTAKELPSIDPLEALKETNAVLQKANQEQAKQIENLQKTNTRLVDEISLLRAQVTELTKLIKGNHQKETPQAEPADPDGPEEMDTGEDTQETPEKQTVEPRETRAPSFAEAARKNLRVSQLGPLHKRSSNNSAVWLVHMLLHSVMLRKTTQPCLNYIRGLAEALLENCAGQ